MHELLDDENFLLYCARHYKENLSISAEEFKDDINRIRYIKKLFTRYEQSGDLKERLILNHLIILNNMFGPYHCSRIIFLKFQNQFELIKPFLILLNLLPDFYYNINAINTVYNTDDYGLDPVIVERLRKV
jgi:hypothetical protein